MSEISRITRCRNKLERALTEDTNWIANEMYYRRLLGQQKRDDVTNARSMLSNAEKAGMIVSALEKKVEINPGNLQKFVDMLRTHPQNIFEDAIELLYPSENGQPPPGVHGQTPPGIHGQTPYGQPPPGAHGQTPPGIHGQTPYGQPPPGAHGQTPYGQPPPGAHGQTPYGQPPPGAHGQTPYGQPPPGVHGQTPYGQPPPGVHGQTPYGQPAPGIHGQTPYGPPPPGAHGQTPYGPPPPDCYDQQPSGGYPYYAHPTPTAGLTRPPTGAGQPQIGQQSPYQTPMGQQSVPPLGQRSPHQAQTGSMLPPVLAEQSSEPPGTPPEHVQDHANVHHDGSKEDSCQGAGQPQTGQQSPSQTPMGQQSAPPLGQQSPHKAQMGSMLSSELAQQSSEPPVNLPPSLTVLSGAEIPPQVSRRYATDEDDSDCFGSGNGQGIPWSDDPEREIRYIAKNRGAHTPMLKLKSENMNVDCVAVKPIKPDSADNNTSPNDHYPMNKDKHGIALIINNELFKQKNFRGKWEVKDKRESTMTDEHNLKETLLFLGYQVEVRRNQSSEEILSIFDNLDTLLKQFGGEEAHDSFICCILTHGDKETLQGSDFKSVNRIDIEEKTGHSVILKGKPKIFIIQACQGKGLPETIDNVAADPTMPVHTPVRGDTYIWNSTVSGDKSFRYTDGTGSFFIIELCSVVCECAIHKNLDSLVKRVSERVAKLHTYDHKTKDKSGKIMATSSHVQQTCCSDQLHKTVHFFFNYTPT